MKQAIKTVRGYSGMTVKIDGTKAIVREDVFQIGEHRISVMSRDMKREWVTNYASTPEGAIANCKKIIAIIKNMLGSERVCKAYDQYGMPYWVTVQDIYDMFY